jgi:hypothetical protein
MRVNGTMMQSTERVSTFLRTTQYGLDIGKTTSQLKAIALHRLLLKGPAPSFTLRIYLRMKSSHPLLPKVRAPRTGHDLVSHVKHIHKCKSKSIGMTQTIQSGNSACYVAGVEHVLMCNNSELRTLYDVYSQLQVPWIHSSDYHTVLEKRCNFGLLSMQFWRMLHDGCILSAQMSLSVVNSILRRCCVAPAAIVERRRRVHQSICYPGVWTFNLPDHSPYRARSLIHSGPCGHTIVSIPSRY